jgi:hypothetical protein
MKEENTQNLLRLNQIAIMCSQRRPEISSAHIYFAKTIATCRAGERLDNCEAPTKQQSALAYMIVAPPGFAEDVSHCFVAIHRSN